jgi:RimJ/RimL family protein N-acetyltransferase
LSKKIVSQIPNIIDYECLASSSYCHGEYTLLALRQSDMSLIKDWRNQQVDVLRQKKQLTEEDQERYFSSVVVPSFNQKMPDLMLFSLLHGENCVGYGGMVNIDWESKRAEISTLINPESHKSQDQYKEDILAMLTVLKDIAFGELGFHRLFTETFDIRPFHISILEEFGFVMEGRLNEHNLIGNQWVDSIFHGLINA